MDKYKDEISNFPEGSKNREFFDLLLKKLGPNLTRKCVDKELKEVQGNLSESIQQYFKYHVIMNATIKAVEQVELQQNKKEATPCKSLNEVSQANIHPLYLNMVKKYVPASDTSHEVKPLGLNQEYISKILGNKRKSERERQEFTKLVENNINDFCLKLTEYSGYNFVSGDWKNAFNKASKHFTCKTSILCREEAKLLPNHSVINELLLTYYKELSEALSMLDKLIHMYEEKLNFESDVVQFYSYKCQTLHMKVRLVELDIKKATYNEQTIPALKKISEQLDAKKERLEEELDEKTTALKAYQFLGSEFEALVEEYTRVINCIKDHKWSLEEVKRTKLKATKDL